MGIGSSLPAKGKVVFITGTSRGIGKTTAEHFEKLGYVVYGSSRQGGGGNPKMLTLDITDPASCQAAVDEIVRKEGRLDILVNNASFHCVGCQQEFTIEELRSITDTNYFGTVNMMKAATGQMLKQRFGRIINVSSVGGEVGMPFSAGYSGAKHAVTGYSYSVRLELKLYNVFVSIVSPAGGQTGTLEMGAVTKAAAHGTDPLFATAVEKFYQRYLVPTKEDESVASIKEQVAAAIEGVAKNASPKFMNRVGLISGLVMFQKRNRSQAAFEGFWMGAMGGGMPTKPAVEA